MQEREDLGCVVFRRRRCLECGTRFSTYEVRVDEDNEVQLGEEEK